MSIGTPEFASWLLGSLRSGLVAVDAKGAIAALNAGAQRILDCPSGPPEVALGLDCRVVLARQPTVAQLLLDALDGRERPSRTELVLEKTNGRPPRTIGFTLHCVRDAADALRGAAILFRDLTPYERMGEQERLRERLAALGQMAAGLAHEIRNPLAGMEVMAGLLRRRLEDRPEERALVEELSSEIRRLAETVTASLEFVRPVELRREEIDPVELLEEALAIARTRVPFGGQIERDYGEAVPRVRADRERVGAVLTNLIVNAFEAMSAEEEPGVRRLRLSLWTESAEGAERPLRVNGAVVPFQASGRVGREVVLAVSDTGAGVPEELRERIFYPFFTTKEHGSGVGLANAQKIVAGHGGQLELESREGFGSTFRVRLPAGEEETV